MCMYCLYKRLKEMIKAYQQLRNESITSSFISAYVLGPGDILFLGVFQVITSLNWVVYCSSALFLYFITSL